MKLVPGISAHFVQSKKFKTNKITIRFTAPLSLETVAGRMLSASMLETANQAYPTSQVFRRYLASLYGTDISTSAYRRGQAHILDLTFTYVRDDFLSKKNVLTSRILELVKQTLFAPLVQDGAFEPALFEIERKQLLASLATDMDDSFYFAHKELDSLFFHDERLQLRYSDLRNCISNESPKSSHTCFQDALKNDRIDFFFLGDFNEVEITESLKSLPFTARNSDVTIQYHQSYSNVLQEGMVQRNVGQSILEMGYHSPVKYSDDEHLPMLVMNGLLGEFAHSKLFTNVRENAGIAYSVSSQLDLFSGLLRMYAGIDRENRNQARKMMNHQLLDLKKGNFTDFELEQTKEMIRRSLLMAQDNQQTLVERIYLNALFGKSSFDMDRLVAKLESVDKEAVCKAANSLKLQAIYFMEGVE
ncbi:MULTISPECIES: EF-P 5-aminopentanol modification-associated protein YfmF [Streptococcus]|uniref:EF-P 5-aminopentanol modification-associated protein YfmF n=1 Tax=Streptococcus TaxID=1301 RepID=UPI00025AA49F|nr:MULTISPECIES: pitrilysin family protein [Streptococcus]EID25318.1 peptidase M16 inactive domain protein [Streptococcus oralis SK1074]EJO21159.1 peptidase M16 inactive domain protein [Streptococcus sp. BS35b]ETS91101.1 peptidase M16 inactive domain protein [Streptococcus sp. BS29a]EUB29048.1 peptidase M16 inactive domain protein [Streptococcus sp. BS21]MCY7104760.1 insulinase family protein [Streptococcus oralis]